MIAGSSLKEQQRRSARLPFWGTDPLSKRKTPAFGPGFSSVPACAREAAFAAAKPSRGTGTQKLRPKLPLLLTPRGEQELTAAIEMVALILLL